MSCSTVGGASDGIGGNVKGSNEGIRRDGKETQGRRKSTRSFRDSKQDENRSLSVNKFMVHYFIRMILHKFSGVFFDIKSTPIPPIAEYEKEVRGFLKTMLRRSGSSRLHFKRICCIIMKFAQSCSGETNYMRFLRYDFLKLLVVSFVFTDNRYLNQNYRLYSSITGLSVEEIKNCCAIVRPILTRQTSLDRIGSTGQNCPTIITRLSNDCGFEQSAGAGSGVYRNRGDNIVSPEETLIQVSSSELEQFNDMGIRMVREYLNLA